MKTIKLTIPCHVHHNAQVVTGFLRLKAQGWDVKLEDCSKEENHRFYGLPVLLAEYRGKKLFYDLWDGYTNLDDMEAGLEWADLYFKRSFSGEKNAAFFPEAQKRMLPLGFNYHLTCRGNPVNEPLWKALAKPLLGRAPDVYFTAEVFEGKARPQRGNPRILFLTRLWDDHDPTVDEASNQERTGINKDRIRIIRTLREQYGDAFVGGLNDNVVSRAWAPDLIMPDNLTERKKYVSFLHSCDICIGTTGLYESIGWKTGEYVAAAKAIVHEDFHYQVPGDFREGKNYLTFTTADECVAAVQSLVEDPQRLFDMQRANEQYYRDYLKPEVLVKNSLQEAEKFF